MTVELKEKTLLETIRQLQTELAELRQKVARLEDHVPAAVMPTSTSTNRRRMLSQLGKALLVAGVGAVALPTVTQARVVSGSNPGALVLRNGATTSGTLPAFNYGLIASSDMSLAFANLNDGDTAISGVSSSTDGTGIFGFGKGTGVIGYSAATSSSIGVYGISDSGTALYGESTSGTGLQANSQGGNGIGGASDSGRGGYFFSNSNFGCEVQSGSSVPLRLFPGIGDTPPGGVTAVGAIWSDSTGNLFAYTSTGWRQIQFVGP